ncbi:leucine Rich Repeat family protein [Aphelenchoides avenae]|nr:leucine Rich Repeat family protein [Aphelenchus avenae]
MPALTVKELKELLDGSDLDLSTRQLEDIPVKQLKEIPRATSLDLSNNQIFTIPPEFCTLAHIVRLDLSRNGIGYLPDNIGELKNLASLDLFRNEISELPLSFGRLAKLKYLDLKHNPLDAELAKVAGDFHDHDACTKAATEVVNFMKKKAERHTHEIAHQAPQKTKAAPQPKGAEENKAGKQKKKKKADEQKNVPKNQSQPVAQASKEDRREQKKTPLQTPQKVEKPKSSGSWLGWISLVLFLGCFALTMPVALTVAKITDTCLYPETTPGAGRDVKAFCDGVATSVQTFSLHPSVTSHFRPVIRRYWGKAIEDLSAKAKYFSENGLNQARDAFIFAASFVAVTFRPIIDFVVHFVGYFAGNCVELFNRATKLASDYAKDVDTAALYDGFLRSSESAWKVTKSASLELGKTLAYYADIFVKWSNKTLVAAGESLSALMADPQGTVNRARASLGV